MNDARLRLLADRAGLLVDWDDAEGRPHVVADPTLRALLSALDYACDTPEAIEASIAALSVSVLPPLVTARIGEPIALAGLPADRSTIAWHLWREDGGTSGGSVPCHDGRCSLPAIDAPGYHRLDLDGREITLAVAPARCFSVADACGSEARAFATSSQLYALRSGGQAPLGSGDFGALLPFCQAAGRAGADAVAISPVHAGFAADAHRFSPYAPSTRLFTNVLSIDPCQAFGTAAVEQALVSLGLADEQRRLEDADLIDWPGVAQLRMTMLRQLVSTGMTEALDTEFEHWRAAAGEALEHHACFEALHAVQFARGEFDWHHWPEALRDPQGAAVRAFAREHAGEVRFHAVLQWLAARGLAAAQAAARGAGMRIGLIGDLAVGTDPSGSHAWSRQGELLADVKVGAPPDLLSPLGQDWGLTAFSPTALMASGYRAWIELLRASFANVGGLRIDHVLGLGRLWLIPLGAPSSAGAYLRFPFDDMTRLIALESWRHRTIVIGENLGTVPQGFNERLVDTGILGIEVLWFKRDWQGGFVHARDWDRHSIATTTTHDLPTVEGWWAGREIDWRVELDQLGPGETEAGLRRTRRDDRERLCRTLGIATGERAPLDDIIEFVATAPSPLTLIPIEDLLGLVEQPNLPGTTSGHPNWQRRLPCRGSTCLDSAVIERRIERLKSARRTS